MWRREAFPEANIATALTILAIFFSNTAVSYYRIKEDHVYQNEFTRKIVKMKFGLLEYFRYQREKKFQIFKAGLISDLILIASLIALFALPA